MTSQLKSTWYANIIISNKLKRKSFGVLNEVALLHLFIKMLDGHHYYKRRSDGESNLRDSLGKPIARDIKKYTYICERSKLYKKNDKVVQEAQKVSTREEETCTMEDLRKIYPPMITNNCF